MCTVHLHFTAGFKDIQTLQSLEQIPTTAVRARVQKNIAAALLALGKHHQGAETLGLVVEGVGDAAAAFNLLLCSHALGDAPRMRTLFDSLLKIAAPEVADGREQEGDAPDELHAELLRLRSKMKRWDAVVVWSGMVVFPASFDIVFKMLRLPFHICL